MSYNQAIPQATDDPSASQPQLLANFQALNTANSVNHVAYNDADEGKHKFLQMPEQGSAPTTGADEGAVYTKDVSGATELFYRRESNGDEQQLTGAFTAASTGELTLPGGLGIKWGTVTATTGGATVLYTGLGLTAFSSATYNVQLTSNVAAFNEFRVGSSLAKTGFTAQCNTGTMALFWMAIGK